MCICILLLVIRGRWWCLLKVCSCCRWCVLLCLWCSFIVSYSWLLKLVCSNLRLVVDGCWFSYRYNKLLGRLSRLLCR